MTVNSGRDEPRGSRPDRRRVRTELNPGSDEGAYAQNRRDEFEITAGGDNLVAPQ